MSFQRMLRSVRRHRRCEWSAAFRDVCRRSTSRSRTGTGGEDYCSVNFEFGRTLLPTVHPGATSFIAEPLWPKTTELTSQQRNARSARPELQATSKPPQFTCVLLVGEGSIPGLATSGKMNSSPVPSCLPEPPKSTAGYGAFVAEIDIYVSRE